MARGLAAGARRDGEDHWFRTTIAPTAAATLRLRRARDSVRRRTSTARACSRASRCSSPRRPGRPRASTSSSSAARALDAAARAVRASRARAGDRRCRSTAASAGSAPRSSAARRASRRRLRSSARGARSSSSSRAALAIDASARAGRRRRVLAVRCAPRRVALEVTVAGVTDGLRPAAGRSASRASSAGGRTRTASRASTTCACARDGRGRAARRLPRHSAYADDVERGRLALHVNGEPVFVRGAVWTPRPRGDELRGDARGAARRRPQHGPGRGHDVYETDAFHDLVRRARAPGLAGPDVRQHGLPDRRRRRSARSSRRGAPGARRASRAAEPRGGVRQQRGRAAGGDARARPRSSAAASSSAS